MTVNSKSLIQAYEKKTYYQKYRFKKYMQLHQTALWVCFKKGFIVRKGNDNFNWKDSDLFHIIDNDNN